MKRILLVLLLLLLVPSPVRANAVLGKGAHVTSGLNPTLFNTLNNDYWMGDDSVIADLNNSQNLAVYGTIQAEYINRIPFNTDANKLAIVNALPNHGHKHEIGNECDLNNHTPVECAGLDTAAINTVLASDPNAYIILQLASQSNFLTYSPQLWDALSQSTKDHISAISFHYYPSIHRDVNGVFDPIATALEVKQFVRQIVRVFMNQRGIADGWLTETGLDAAQVTKPEAALFVPVLWSNMQTFAWLKGTLWYDYMYNGLNYVTLCNIQQTQCNKVGQAWENLQ